MSSKVRWSVGDTTLLTVCAKTHTVKELAETLNRSLDSIRHKLRSLHLKAKKGVTVKLTVEEYRNLIKESGIICLEEYVSSITPLLHRCARCNYEWKIRPNNIISGCGCPKCAETGFNPGKPAYLYLLLIENSIEVFLKVGITNKTIKHRTKQILKSCSENSTVAILYTKYSNNGKEIYNLEQEIHNNKRLNKFITLNEYMDGKTELYDYTELDNLKCYFSK